MFPAILSTVISSFSDVFWKKSLSYNVRYIAQSLASYPAWLLLSVYFIINGFDFSTINITSILVVLIILLIDIIKDPLAQQIYREEKMSILMPYLNLHKIFIIISSFFLFHDVSTISLCITILTALIIMLAAVDIKNKRLPRNFWKILFTQSARAVWTLLGWWMILNYSETSYFILYVLFGISIYSLLTIRTWQFSDYKKVPPAYWGYRFVGALWWFSWFLSLVVIKNLWLSISILLWFLWIGVTLLIGYIFSKDVPSKKSIILTIVVAILIGLWYYFK